MGWDGVPWMTEGAEHSAAVGRNVAFQALGGQQGIATPTDLQVKELAVPAGSIRVIPGMCGIENVATGALQEMYVGRLPSQDVVPITATDALGGRSDLVIARVENPSLSGEPWDPPADPTVGPYIFTRVIEDVDPTTTDVADLGLGYSALTLARIDIPVSTGTITQDMIVDLRKLSQSRSSRQLHMTNPTTTATITSADFANWTTEVNWQLAIPKWATHMNVVATIAGAVYGAAGTNGGNGWTAQGECRIQLGVAATDANYSESTKYNVSNDSGIDRQVVMATANRMPVPSALRGKAATVRIQGRKQSGSTSLAVDGGSSVVLDVEFLSAVESA